MLSKKYLQTQKCTMKNLVLVIGLLFIGNVLFSQDFKYIGAQKCKMCHNSDEKGKQFTKWSESLHAKAFATLQGEEAIKYGKEHGIADPSKEPKCLKCHATAAGIDAGLLAGLTMEEGVSCESCHGAGSSYKSISVMKDTAQALKNGLIIPDETICKKCHNPESPNYKPFDFVTYSQRIAHPNPKK
jgi:hypothetical protein